MPIDVHAHYVPPRLLERIVEGAEDYGLTVVREPPSCALHFHQGPRIRPFFPELIEDTDRRLEGMANQGIDRQILSPWADIFGYGLPPDKAARWHRLINECLAAHCARHPQRFALFASVPLPDAAAAARELDFAVRTLGAVGAVVAANVEGVNLGEIRLDEFWAAAVERNVPVFIHPVQAKPEPRARRFGLTQIAHYTFDTTLCVGSLIFSGVLDRFPELKLILSHGGGAFPYLMGRFDCMHERMNRQDEGDVAAQNPSAYVRRFHYDTILHHPKALRWLVEMVSAERVVLGSDYSFPPADRDPVASVLAAGLADADVRRILDDNARDLFSGLASG